MTTSPSMLNSRLGKTSILGCSILVFIFGVFGGCSGDEKKGDVSDVGDGNNNDNDDDDDDESGGSFKGSGDRTSPRSTLTQSLSNNILTSQTINISKAGQIVDKMQSGKGKGFFEEKLSAERLARRGVGPVMATARRVAALEMEKGATNSLSDPVKLEIALAAMAAKNYYLAEYLLPLLVESKLPRVKAGAHNALGVMALIADRVPEAVLYFKESLKIVENYKPAMLNLGVSALKGGDLALAKRYLGDMQNDWFVQVNMITIARLEGNNSKAGELCSKLVSKYPDHKAALFNCALFELQNKEAYAKARSYAEKATRAKHGEAAWDEKVFNLTNTIDIEESEKKRKAAQKAAQEKAKKAQKNPPNQPANPQSPAGSSPPPASSPADSAPPKSGP